MRLSVCRFRKIRTQTTLRTVRELGDLLAANLTKDQAFSQITAPLIDELQRGGDFTDGVQPLDGVHVPVKNLTLGVAGQTTLRVGTAGHEWAGVEGTVLDGLHRAL